MFGELAVFLSMGPKTPYLAGLLRGDVNQLRPFFFVCFNRCGIINHDHQELREFYLTIFKFNL